MYFYLKHIFLFFSYIYFHELPASVRELLQEAILVDRLLVTTMAVPIAEKMKPLLRQGSSQQALEVLLTLERYGYHILPGIYEEVLDKISFRAYQTWLDPSFFTLSEKSLLALLDRPHIALSETDIVQVMYKWTLAQCTQAGIPPTPEHLKRYFSRSVFASKLYEYVEKMSPKHLAGFLKKSQFSAIIGPKNALDLMIRVNLNTASRGIGQLQREQWFKRNDIGPKITRIFVGDSFKRNLEFFKDEPIIGLYYVEEVQCSHDINLVALELTVEPGESILINHVEQKFSMVWSHTNNSHEGNIVELHEAAVLTKNMRNIIQIKWNEQEHAIEYWRRKMKVEHADCSDDMVDFVFTSTDLTVLTGLKYSMAYEDPIVRDFLV